MFPWLVAMFLRCLSIFQVTIKGQKLLEAVSIKKTAFLLTERFILRPTPIFTNKQTNNQTNKNPSPIFFRLSDFGITFLLNTNVSKRWEKKLHPPWGDHEIMARIHPSWRSHLCSLLGCSFNGLGAPCLSQLMGWFWGWMGWICWMSCCGGSIQNYPNWWRNVGRFQVYHIPHLQGWFWMWWEDVDFGDDKDVLGQSTDFWPSTIEIYLSTPKHRGK